MAYINDKALKALEQSRNYWNDQAVKAQQLNAELVEVLEDCLGNINPERGFADELEEDIRRAIDKTKAGQP